MNCKNTARSFRQMHQFKAFGGSRTNIFAQVRCRYRVKTQNPPPLDALYKHFNGT